MSVVIDMDMPDMCGHCILASALCCCVDGKDIPDHHKLREDCPLGLFPEDVVSKMKYDSLKADRDRLLEEYRNMAQKVASLRRKIRDMKSGTSWDEDARRGQVQGMW